MAEKKPANLAEALIAFQSAVPGIATNRKGQHGAFADLPHVLSVIRPALSSAGLAVSQIVDTVGDQPALRTTLMHTSGQEITGVTPLCINREPMKKRDGSVIALNPSMEFGKALTYQRRYALQSILGICIGMEDCDPDLPDSSADPAPTATQTQETKPAVKAQKEESIYGAPLEYEIRKSWVEFLKDAPPEWRKGFVKAFATQFETGNRKVSEQITHNLHAVFCQEYVEKNPMHEAAAK